MTERRDAFPAPLHMDPGDRALLERVGIVDVGSNSVRLVVFDGAARSPAYFYNEKILCGLGAGVARTRRLNPRGKERAMSALARFGLLAEGMGIAPLRGVATAAVREARDGPEFTREVRERTGIDLWTASGEEEARLAAQGVLLGWPGASGLVCDVGGSSMEMARLDGGEIQGCLSAPIGPLSLKAMGLGGEELRSRVARSIAEVRGRIPGPVERLFLVGGSWRMIARLDMERVSYPLKVLHEYRIKPGSLKKTLGWIEELSPGELGGLARAYGQRRELIPAASMILSEISKAFRPREIVVSGFGIREGILYGQMPESLRARDPLIEVCGHMEAASARMPGFGKVLFDFLLPLFRGVPEDRVRLVRAACLLHDVSWRAHPDYRAEVCFDNITRANLAGLDHAGRVFLGLALLRRYRNSRSGTAFEAVSGLIGKSDRKLAEMTGAAMRFGAMLTVDSRGMGELAPRPEEGVLELRLKGPAAGLFGEVAKARFETLAKAMGCEPIARVI